MKATFHPDKIAGILLALFALATASAAAASIPKFEALLVWATNDEQPPNDSYKSVDAGTQKKLESLNLKWKKFYLVKQVTFEVQNDDSGKVAISDKSSLAVKMVGEKKIEVVFYGKKGEECSRRTQTLKTGETLVHGGNVTENATAWLVTLKRVK